MKPVKADPLSKLTVGEYKISQYPRQIVIRQRHTVPNILSYLFAALFLGFWIVTKSIPGAMAFLGLTALITLFQIFNQRPIVLDLETNLITQGKKTLGFCDQVLVLVKGDLISKTLTIYGPETEIWTTESNSKAKIEELEKAFNVFLPSQNVLIENMAKHLDPNVSLDDDEVEEEDIAPLEAPQNVRD